MNRRNLFHRAALAIPLAALISTTDDATVEASNPIIDDLIRKKAENPVMLVREFEPNRASTMNEVIVRVNLAMVKLDSLTNAE